MLTDEALFFDCKKKEKQVMSVFFLLLLLFSLSTLVFSPCSSSLFFHLL